MTSIFLWSMISSTLQKTKSIIHTFIQVQYPNLCLPVFYFLRQLKSQCYCLRNLNNAMTFITFFCLRLMIWLPLKFWKPLKLVHVLKHLFKKNAEHLTSTLNFKIFPIQINTCNALFKKGKKRGKTLFFSRHWRNSTVLSCSFFWPKWLAFIPWQFKLKSSVSINFFVLIQHSNHTKKTGKCLHNLENYLRQKFYIQWSVLREK